MGSRRLALSERLSERVYGSLLQAYPAAFRERFAGEMLQVFRCLSREAYAQTGLIGILRLWLAAGWDLTWGAITQWWRHLTRRRTGNMGTSNDFRDGIQPLPARQALIAALPFLAFGLSSLVSKLDYFHTGPSSLPLWQVLLITPHIIFNWLVLIGLGIGIFLGFPRWAFPYLGWALLFAWWWSDMGFYGYFVGWKIWLPLLGAFIIALAIRRSWQPLRALFTGLWKEWTLLSLALYIFYSFVYMEYDENHHPYLLLFIAITTLVISAGAYAYYRSASPLRRVLWLMSGIIGAAVLSAISYVTWDFRTYYGLPEGSQRDSLIGIIFAVVLGGIMLVNGLLARWRMRRAARLG
jgi:hypothetical protein